MRNVAFFLVITLFAGSTVIVAAWDIQKRLAPPTDTERTALQEMIRDIQGENVVPAVKAAMDKAAMPDRSQGSYLVRKDIERIKKFLVSLVRSDDTAEAPQEAPNEEHK